MPKGMQLSLPIREDDELSEELEDLEDLIEQYLKKSEELEKRESKVLQQVELLQSALASLQAWKDGRKATVTFTESEIDEESKKIKEETQRIQKEIKKKIEENQKLEEEIDRRKIYNKENPFDSIIRNVSEEDKRIGKVRKEEIETRKIPEKELKLELPLLKEKLLKLEEMGKKLKKELMEGSEEFKKKKKNFNEKIALLEWESVVHKKFVENLKKQNEKEKNSFINN